MPRLRALADPTTRERSRRRSWVRALVPALLILGWLAGASLEIEPQGEGESLTLDWAS